MPNCASAGTAVTVGADQSHAARRCSARGGVQQGAHAPAARLRALGDRSAAAPRRVAAARPAQHAIDIAAKNGPGEELLAELNISRNSASRENARPLPLRDRPAAALNVAVAGATGRVGRLVVQTLLDEGNSVVALARSGRRGLRGAAKGCGLPLHRFWHGGCGRRANRARIGGSPDLVRVRLHRVGRVDRRARPQGGHRLVVQGHRGDVLVGGRHAAGVVGIKKRAAGRRRRHPDHPPQPGRHPQQKAKAEQMLRDSGLPYSIVRPTGLKFDGWPRGRPILSQGDVAVGRTNPDDLAAVLVGALTEPAAHKKTFEFFTLAGYPAPRARSRARSRSSRPTAGRWTRRRWRRRTMRCSSCCPARSRTPPNWKWAAPTSRLTPGRWRARRAPRRPSARARRRVERRGGRRRPAPRRSVVCEARVFAELS